MGKITILMESGLAGLIDSLEFRKRKPGIKSNTGNISFENVKQASLRSFILKDKHNRKYLLFACLGLMLQFITFKVLYPYPDFISDSYSYIDTNIYHMDVNLWPIGYSKYLSLLHSISPSDTLLIFSQFFILEISFLYFFYTVLFLYNISEIYTRVLYIFLFFNPLFLFLSNCVLSDGIFCALSLIWITQMLWMFKKPRNYQILVHALLIGVLFSIRYTAIYYPFVTAFAYLLSRQRPFIKLAGIISPWVLIIPFILYTQQKTKEITGTAQFSVFGGWQLANNALYMYDHIQVDSTELPAGTKELDKMVRQFYKQIPEPYRDFGPFPGTYFIKMPNAVLKPYMMQRYAFSNAPEQFRAWGKVAPIYQSYGSYLTKHYPLDFAHYYLWLNTKNYFIPHLEKFGSYNLAIDTVWTPAKDWFQYKTTTITAAFFDLQDHLFYFLPAIFMLLNLYFAGSLLWLIFSGAIKKIPWPLLPALLLVTVYLFLNFCFSIFATPVVLRYQILPMILLLTFSLVLNKIMDNADQSGQNKHTA